MIETDEENSHGSESDEITPGRLVPYGDNLPERKQFLEYLKKHLFEYEGDELKESQRRILLGVQTAKANLLDKAIHAKKLKKEKLEYKKTVKRTITRASTLLSS